jgi:hypothetical protein
MKASVVLCLTFAVHGWAQTEECTEDAMAAAVAEVRRSNLIQQKCPYCWIHRRHVSAPFHIPLNLLCVFLYTPTHAQCLSVPEASACLKAGREACECFKAVPTAAAAQCFGPCYRKTWVALCGDSDLPAVLADSNGAESVVWTPAHTDAATGCNAPGILKKVR